MARPGDACDQRYVSVILGEARRLNELLGSSPGGTDEALRLLAIDAPLILEAQRHAKRLSDSPEMARAVRQFAGLELLADQALGSHQWICWAQDSLDIAREGHDPFTLAIAEGDLARALAVRGESGTALAHFVRAIDGFRELGDDESCLQAATLASLALGPAFEADRTDLLRGWLELAEGEPRLNEHGRCRVTLMRARLQARENGGEAAIPSLRVAVEMAAHHGCPRCSAFANSVAGQLLIRRRSVALPFYQRALEAYSQSRLWVSSATIADVLLGLTILAPEVLPENVTSFGKGHGLSEEGLYRLRCEEDPGRPLEVAQFAQRVGEARSALLASGPVSERNRPHAALLAWVHASALRFADKDEESGSLFLEVVTEYDTELSPKQRRQAYYFALRFIMVRSREDIENGDLQAMLASYHEATELAQQSRYLEFIAETELEIASCYVWLYQWALGQASAEAAVNDTALLFADSWGRVPPIEHIPELRDRRLTLLKMAQEAGLLPK